MMDYTIKEGMPGSPEEQKSKVPDVPPGSTYTALNASTSQGDPVRNPGTLAEQSGVSRGMQVMGSDNAGVGVVKELQDGGFIVDRTLAPDIFVPYSAVQGLDKDVVVLNVPADRADELPRTNGSGQAERVVWPEHAPWKKPDPDVRPTKLGE